jgi:alkylation response protein AidB-like acyl-CoA dehydrogenase
VTGAATVDSREEEGGPGAPVAAPPPTPEEFAAECVAFLGSFPAREQARRSFRWGEGSDRVAIFESPEPAAQRAEIVELRAYRRRLFDAGLGWITGPVALGGRGLPRRFQRILDDTARRYAVPSAAPLTISLGMVAPTILAHGTDGAKARYLKALQRGDLIACQLFSEPGAGSDLPAMTAAGRHDGDGWHFNGQKVWTSGAHYSDIGLLICKTGDGPRHHNLSAFVVDMHQPGVEVRPLRQMTGGAAFNEVFFDQAWAPDDDLLGVVNGGWTVAITTLSNERGAVGGAGFGGSGVLNTDRYRVMIQELGRAADPLIRQQFADLYAHLWTAKLNQQRGADAVRRGATPGPEAALGKLALANNFRRVADLVSTVVGTALTADSGEWGTYAWSELVLSTPGYRIGGGTDEIIKNSLAERVLGLPKEPTVPGP